MVLSGFVLGVFQLLWASLLDFACFIVVDIVVKATLKDITDDGERRTIWLYESLVLTAICLLIYIFSHFPYVLLILTVITLIVTQCLNRVSLHEWWTSLQTRWDEYQQHQESIRRDRRLSTQQHGYQNTVQTEAPSFMARMTQKASSLMAAMFSQQNEGDQLTPVSVTPARINRNHSQVNSATPVPGQESPQVTIRWRDKGAHRATADLTLCSKRSSQTFIIQGRMPGTASLSSLSGNTSNSSSVQTRPMASSSAQQNRLTRKPLRNALDHSLSLKSKMLSVLGFNPYVKVPPGLKNDGQNLCFMNSVLQCLARTPHLLDRLSTQAYEEASCSVAESAFVSALTELLRYCNMSPGTSDIAALDPVALQQAASYLPGSPVVPLGHRQMQQDAGEFLMWLLSVIHSVLNKNRKGKESGRPKKTQIDRFNSATLTMLKFVYGDLNAKRIQELKYACRREIDLANGLDNDSYAEPIQRLSDLEWLTYKQDNISIVDDLFSGQLVEAFHCLTDNHISVHMQTFIVLPVPIVAPREVSGLVYLEDCFTKFCNIEHLVGPEGLQCSMCDQGPRSPQVYPSSSAVHTPPPHLPDFRPRPLLRKNILRDSAIGAPDADFTVMSPIPSLNRASHINDSGYHDAHVRTSTPISQDTNGRVPQMTPPRRIRLRDAQRRCLLRQLPECLVIQVMRFAMNMHVGGIRKIRAPVSIPLKNLDLTNLIFDTVTNREDMTAVQNYRYDLYAVCAHLGGESTSYGHYLSYCRNEDGSWHKFDDEVVTEVNMDYELTTKELRENSYLLFYRRQPDKSNSCR